jgi:hypothetical protein
MSDKAMSRVAFRAARLIARRKKTTLAGSWNSGKSKKVVSGMVTTTGMPFTFGIV